MAAHELMARIRRGMDVFGVDGRRIGEVIELKATDPGSTGERASPMPAGEVVAAPLGDPSVDASSGDRGTLPLGTATPKDRGDEATTGIVGGRGDFPTINPVTQSADPRAAGMDMLRGHSPSRSGLGDAQSTAEASARSATGSLYGAGAMEPLAPTAEAVLASGDSAGGAERTPPPEPSERQGTGEPYLLVQDPGTLGIAAQTLHIPLQAVRDVEPDRGVMLALPGEEARMRYGRLGLDLDEDADVLPY